MIGKRFFRNFLGVVFAVFLAFLPTNLAFAKLSESQLNMFSQNNILFYDPTGGGITCYSGNLSGDTIMAKVVNYLSGNNTTGFTLSENGIAGILANFQGESGFNPFRYQGDTLSGPAYGIAQFDPMSKILEPLRTDPRTANYFNEYIDLKYTYFDSETGLPKESVPMEVVDAWLSVQLDFFFGSSSEFENTRVGDYRNLGGSMGLDYISSDMTAHEALDAAKSAEDATRIFVWIMERPADKEGAANSRSQNAQKWLSYVQSMSVISGSVTNPGVSVNGNDVTIIGDSITVNAIAQLEQTMPGVDIHAQVSKQFYNGTADNPAGITILKELVNNNELRSTLVYALGTNGNFTLEQAQEVVDLAGSSRKVIFVTNFTTSDDYSANNNVIAKVKNDNANVSVADWKAAIESQPDAYLSDGVHPNEAGRTLFASIIANTISASGSLTSVCIEGSVNGGLSESQAQALADYYNSNEVDADYWGLPYGKMNCVSFSAFFVQRFTSVGLSPRSWGHGKDFANNLAQTENLPTGTAARPFAVFSVTKGDTVCDDGHLCGHTGIVVAVDGDSLITVEAAYQSSDATVYHRDISYFENTKYGDTFTYLDTILNQSELAQIVGN